MGQKICVIKQLLRKMKILKLFDDTKLQNCLEEFGPRQQKYKSLW